ncbi:MAG TPA: winged helix DNA-binding domain-containing protein [Candidatus Limnocylindrales bacterium]
MQRIDTTERRARIVERHRLAPGTRGASLEDVARSLVGIHSSDPITVFLAGWARLVEPDVGAMERELYQSGTLLRMHGMRRTLFVVPHDVAPAIQAGAAERIAVGERARVLREITQAGLAPDPVAWLAEVEDATLEALRARGEATANQLGVDEPRLRTQMLFNVGKKYEGSVGVSTRLLFLLAMEGRVARGRPAGSWVSSQYHWVPIEAVLPDGYPALDPPAARQEIVRRWLAAFGPGTLADIRWYTGWTVAEVRRILGELDVIDVDLDGTPGIVLADDRGSTPAREPSAAFLPGLDPTVMGWTDRRFYLAGHAKSLFDTNGNAGPTVWWDGRIVGGWAQRRDGGVVHRLLEDIGGEGTAAIDAERDRLQAWLGPARVTPRFRTPFERELAGS